MFGEEYPRRNGREEMARRKNVGEEISGEEMAREELTIYQ
jgi:hypothetical protein